MSLGCTAHMRTRCACCHTDRQHALTGPKAQGGVLVCPGGVPAITHAMPAAILTVSMLLQDQKYKEGCSLIQVASLHIVQASPQEPEAAAAQHRIAVQC